MKKMALAMMLIVGFNVAHGGELENAQKLWDGKEFYKAFQIFNKLAEAGDASAQLQLGEMYGFGEGTGEDPVRAEYWLKQAASKGNPEAAGSLELVKQRQARHNDIAYYTSNFDGANAAYAKFGCVRPQIPARSTTNAEVAAVNAGINTWTECYGRFIANLKNVAAPEQTIQPDVLKLMNNDEFLKSTALIGKVYGGILAQASAIEKEIGNDSVSWKNATEKFAAENNAKVESGRMNTENEINKMGIAQRELMQRTQVKAVGMNK
ncbi:MULTISPECIES: tetratricopeptide repeat protein [unclassified Janthinobacterium]|uniref:tetratricopeptide repeat protein n=1 Tax=unclassified Janthinobacterium TaxID=2610881 RepID=UPI001E572110|nr:MULTISPECIES: hypothetical protein [unclassified Janthinobacterium]MCC7641682.1 sel1 repeat family protein [Janthinobacterium sp. EB271-G4-3-1]MCC7690935.1 sel1 repeat family protein [Janthinobacterium sp. EB271-G4-3-2]